MQTRQGKKRELYSAQRQNTTLAAGEMHGIYVGEIRTWTGNDDIEAYLAGEEQKMDRVSDAQIHSTAQGYTIVEDARMGLRVLEYRQRGEAIRIERRQMVKGERMVGMKDVTQSWLAVERAEHLIGRYFRDGSNFRPRFRMVIL